jgi:hypothetical protein
MENTIIYQLLSSDEPAIRYRTYVDVLGGDPRSAQAHSLRQEIPAGQAASLLLSKRERQGTLPYHPYNKWLGAHWVLACLAELGYPPGDVSLKPMLEQSYNWLLSDYHLKHAARLIDGRMRRCASQEGYCIYYSLALGIADERTQELAQRLLRWQWPDGGWNCDKKPAAHHSSFMESLIPMRALALYERLTGDPDARMAVTQSAEIFLKRELFKRQLDGAVMSAEFVNLYYPYYWRYNILAGLKAMVETGYVHDPRCQPALDLLETKRLPDGGFPAEKKYYQVTERKISGRSRIDWGGVHLRRMNEYITLDALYVLMAAGRIDRSQIMALRELPGSMVS